MFLGFWALNLVFAACECVQRFTDAFGEINDVIDQLDWYLYPVEIQRLLIPIMMNAQKPVTINFFGSITCCREQFRKVCQDLFRLNRFYSSGVNIFDLNFNFYSKVVYAAYSYFMVLKKFYQ